MQEIERAGGRGAAVRPETEQPHIPCRELLRSSPWQRNRCSPAWDRCSSPECFLHKSPRRRRCRCRQTCHRPCRWRIRIQQQCSRRRGRRVASKWAISRTNRDIHISRCRHWGMASSSRSSTSRISAAVPADAAAAVQPLGPADASAALPTVASKFSTANAADAEFSTTSSSNDVS